MTNALNKLYPNLKFLIIDDFENFRSSMRLMLSSFGAKHIDTANTAEEALNKFRYDFYDVILCDYNLGSGKNGQQILEELRIRKRIKHTHLFVMITAETSKDVVLGAREYQPDAYIAKPITRTVLEQRLGQLLIQNQDLKSINKEIDLENHPKAISLCHEKIDTGTRYKSWCYQALAELYKKVGDYNASEKIYHDVLTNREVPWARTGLAKVLVLEQKYQEAKEHFATAIQNNPNMLEAYDGFADSCERLGQISEAQSILQKAVSLCPRLITRQHKLGELCLKNHDLDAATEAFRQTVNYGENSVHQRPDHFLALGRCLCDLSADKTGDESKALADEGIYVLEQANDKFCDDESICIAATLIEARIYHGQDNSSIAEDTLYKAECLIEACDLNATVGLEFAKTLYTFDHEERAHEVLKELSERYNGNPKVLAKIEALMDEPENLSTRLKAKELNKNAISLVDQGKLQQAIEAFESAIRHTPRHAALNLNLVQVIVKHYQSTQNADLLTSAVKALKRLEHIPEQHHQYRRLQHFRKLIDRSLSEHGGIVGRPILQDTPDSKSSQAITTGQETEKLGTQESIAHEQ